MLTLTRAHSIHQSQTYLCRLGEAVLEGLFGSVVSEGAVRSFGEEEAGLNCFLFPLPLIPGMLKLDWWTFQNFVFQTLSAIITSRCTLFLYFLLSRLLLTPSVVMQFYVFTVFSLFSLSFFLILICSFNCLLWFCFLNPASQGTELFLVLAIMYFPSHTYSHS